MIQTTFSAKRSFQGYNDGFKALVLVPSIDLKLQWTRELAGEPSLSEKERIVTYSGAYQFKDRACEYVFLYIGG